ncbi:hypothetical protein G6662_04065 [Polynucleobacter paneuropaeus]|nr:hypothetical protein [Polynucleobacter paneuropaeus]
MKIKPLFGVVLFCRLKRHLQALWRVIGAGMATYLYTLKNRHSQDSDLIAKFDRHKDAKFLDKLRLVTQALEIKAKAVYRRVENPCVGGSIPPRATKKHQNHLRVVFSFGPTDEDLLVGTRMRNNQQEGVL